MIIFHLFLFIIVTSIASTINLRQPNACSNSLAITMKCFSKSHLNDILRKVLSVADQDQLDFDYNCADHILDVKANVNTHHYLLQEVFKSPIVGSQSLSKNTGAIYSPLFVIESNKKKEYAAFENNSLDGYLLVENNNLDMLKLVLRSLAQHQAVNFESSGSSEYAIAKLNEPNAEKLKEFVDVQLLHKNPLFVKTIWSPFGAYHKNDSIRILDLSQGPLMPPIYDALLYIFSLSDEKFRQSHFINLIEFYFNVLGEASKNSEIFTDVYKDMQVSSLLPLAKLTIVNCMPEVKLLANIDNYIKHPQLHPEYICEVVKNKLQSDQYELLEYSLKQLDEANGHLGQYFYLTCIVKFNGNVEKFTLFAKILHAHNESLRVFIENGVGKKEMYFYNTLVPLYKEYGLDSLLDFAANCYLTNSTIVVLDDLSELGYRSLKPNIALDLKGTKSILRRLADLHGSSIILEERISEKLGKVFRFGDAHGQFYNETFFLYEGELREFFKQGGTALIHTLKSKLPHLRVAIPSEEELTEKVMKVIKYPSQHVRTSKVRRNVINHGDLYTGNMLFKFEGDSIVDGKLVDFQLLRYIPPAFEVIFFTLVAASVEVKQNHFEELLNYYYAALETVLREHGVNPDVIYSKKDFQDDVKEMTPAATVLGHHYAHIIVIEPKFRQQVMFDEEIRDYYFRNHKDEFMDIGWRDENYRLRVTELVERMANIL